MISNMADGLNRTRKHREDIGGSEAQDDESTDEESLYSTQKLPESIFSSHEALDPEVPSLGFRSETAEVYNGTGSSSENTDTGSLAQDPDFVTQCGRPYYSLGLPIYSDHPEEGQIGVKRLHSPMFNSTNQADPGPASSSQAHSLPHGTDIDWRQDFGMKLPAGGSHSMGSNLPGLNLEEYGGPGDVRYCKKTRRAQASVILPTVETRRLEEICESDDRFSHARLAYLF